MTKTKRIKIPKPGETLTDLRLKNVYDSYASRVLLTQDPPLLKELPKKKGAPQSYKVVRELPDRDTYYGWRRAKYTLPIESVIDDAFSVVEDLASECREIYDNTPESLQQTERAETFNMTADTLENLSGSKPDVDPLLADKPVMILPPLHGRTGRASRAGDAAAMLREVIAVLEEITEGPEAEHAADLQSELESAADEIEGCEFPGMFG